MPGATMSTFGTAFWRLFWRDWAECLHRWKTSDHNCGRKKTAKDCDADSYGWLCAVFVVGDYPSATVLFEDAGTSVKEIGQLMLDLWNLPTERLADIGQGGYGIQHVADAHNAAKAARQAEYDREWANLYGQVKRSSNYAQRSHGLKPKKIKYGRR